MLYSCADWLTTDVALPQDPTSQYDNYDDFDAMYQPQQGQRSTPTTTNISIIKKQYHQPIKTSLMLPSSPSAVDDPMRSPRSFEELQRGSLSLARSIEEFNAIIDADMNDEYYSPEGVADDVLLSQLLGAHFFEGSYSASASVESASPSSAIKYGWTPFDAGEFQFASVERDDARMQRHQW